MKKHNYVYRPAVRYYLLAAGVSLWILAITLAMSLALYSGATIIALVLAASGYAIMSEALRE